MDYEERLKEVERMYTDEIGKCIVSRDSHDPHFLDVATVIGICVGPNGEPLLKIQFSKDLSTRKIPADPKMRELKKYKDFN